MKNVFLLILLLFVPIAIYAQTEDDENLYNDSTEFFLKYQMIVDTAKVEAIAKAYKEKRKAELAPQIDRLAKELQGLKAITCLDAKEKLSSEDGTMEVYTQLLNELKEVDVTKPVSVSIDDYGKTSRAVLFMHNMDVKKVHIAGLKWIDQYVREKEKAEKQLKKKQLRNSTIMCYVNWVYEKTERDFYNLKDKMESYDRKYHDVFYWYRECEGTDKYPQKQISIRVDNKNYRPKLLFSDSSLDELDLRLQKQGWEWVEKTKSNQRQKESYPYEYSYYSFESHPEYRLVGKNIYDKEGNLVRYISMSRKDIYWDQPKFIEILLMLEYRKDYINNKYNIKNESKDVQYAIVNKLGMSNESDTRMAKAIINGSKGGFLYKYSNDWQESIKGYNQREKAAKEMIIELLRRSNDTARNFLKQLEKDHADDYSYIYKIERLSNVSFKVHFVTKDIKPKCDVVITYYQTKPFSCDWQIDDIVKYDAE